MKIVSKFKDYYDYLVSVYGEDPLKILDRRDYYRNPYDLEEAYTIYFCGDIYSKIKVDGFIKYNNADIDVLIDKGMLRYKHLVQNNDFDVVFKDFNFVVIKIPLNKYMSIYRFDNYMYEKLTSLIENTNKPYYFIKTPIWSNKDTGSFPILSEIGFSKFMSASDCYLKIEEYISKKDVDIDNQPEDMIRFESKGFNKKTSFRHDKTTKTTRNRKSNS